MSESYKLQNVHILRFLLYEVITLYLSKSQLIYHTPKDHLTQEVKKDTCKSKHHKSFCISKTLRKMTLFYYHQLTFLTILALLILLRKAHEYNSSSFNTFSHAVVNVPLCKTKQLLLHFDKQTRMYRETFNGLVIR